MSVDTRVISASEDWLPEALAVLRDGGLVAFPTDTVYGLGALVHDSTAIEAIFRAKGRPTEKSIPVLLAGWQEVSGVAVPTGPAHRLAVSFWPGPLTIVLEREPQLPEVIGPGGTVGVRAPDHPVALALLEVSGPLAVTSANRSGGASPRSAAEVLADLGGRVGLVIDGGLAPGGRPSTVVDCTGESPRLVREGPVPMDEVQAAWG